jgi:hypothetical protein
MDTVVMKLVNAQGKVIHEVTVPNIRPDTVIWGSITFVQAPFSQQQLPDQKK